MTLHAPIASLFVGLLIFATGCSGDKKSKLSGTITYKNEPVKAGMIYLTNDAGAGYSSPIQSDGAYVVTDIPPGSYSVTVETESINPDAKGSSPAAAKGGNYAGGMVGKNAKMQDEYAQQMGKGGGAPGGGPSREELLKRYTKLPAKYAVKTTSDLKVEVQSGATLKDFPLTD